MSETKHTPGPWCVDSEGLGKGGGPWDRVTIETIAPGGGTVIAEINSMLPWEANARLIAAAPELYEALKHMVELDRCGHDANEKARAALAKVTP